jgi:crotonobetaine/carnitine-CoA ligase
MHAYTSYFPFRAEQDELDVVSVLRKGLSDTSPRSVMSFLDDEWSASRLRVRITQLQAILAGQGIGKGDRVAVMLDNSPDHVALIFALILLGAVWVPVNTRLKSTGIEYLVQHSEPALFIVETQYAGQASSACGGGTLTRLLPHSALEVSGAPVTELTVAPVTPADLLCIIYTSGTTGAPKGVLFTHRMLRIAAESVLTVADVHEGDRLFLWEPLCHIGGAQMLLVPFMVDASLYAVPRFSASRFWQQIEQGQCTQVHYLGGILDIVMGLEPQRQPSSHSLRLGWGAGVSRQNWAAVRERMQIALRECYGMTEGSSFATVNADDCPGSIGKALPWLTVELLDENDHPVPAGELGQIVVSSAIPGTFFSGYLNNPEATAEVLRNGKLYTGDMARTDDSGHLYFVGRSSDSMRIRGENVSAWEVERVALAHPAVAAAAAVGVASDIGEQEILLYVQWRQREPSASEPTFDALSQWLGERLAPFQWPRYYAAVEQFELTPSERIRKHFLPRVLDAAWDRRGVLSTRG